MKDMETKTKIPVDILVASDKKVAVKVPFLDIPVSMGKDFFKTRIVNGYFQIKRRSRKKLPETLVDRVSNN